MDEDELLELGEAALEPPLAEPELLGCCALELDELSLLPLVLGVLAPPEALEPDLAGSCVPLADELDEPGVEAAPEGEDELDEAAPGLLGLPALPPTEAEPDAEPGELGGVEEALLLLPLVPAGPAERWLSSPQAARPSAIATATARVESFMKPPWLGYWKLAARTEPARSPLESGPYARRTNAAPAAR